MCKLLLTKIDCSGNKLWSKLHCIKSCPGQKIIIVAKFNTDGTLLMYKTIDTMNSSGNVPKPNMVLDSSGNMYITFQTDGSIPPETNVGMNDVVIMKLDPSGNTIWVKQDISLNTTLNDITPKLQIDNSNNLYITYSTQGTVSGGTSSGGYDIVVGKLDSDGNVIWILQQPVFNTSADDINSSMDIDPSGNVYIAYQTTSNIPGKTNQGLSDVVVFKVDTDGNVIWTKQEPQFDTPQDDSTPSITVDTSGNTYIAYTTTGTIQGNYNVVNSGGIDIALVKFDTDGNIVWRAQHPAFNSIDDDINPTIFVDSHQNLYLTYEKTGTDVPSSVVYIKFTTISCNQCCGDSCSKKCNLCFPKIDINNICINKIPDCKQLKIINSKCKYIFERMNNIFIFYNKELCMIKNLIRYISMMLNNMNNLSCDKNSNSCILKELENIAKLYNEESAKTCNGKKLGNNSNTEIYGTIEMITGKPTTFVNGFGGIKNTEIFGTLTLTQNKIYNFNMVEGDDVAFLADKIRSKLCDKIAVIDGLEVGIKINCPPGVLKMTLCSRDKGNISGEFKVDDDSNTSYKKLLNEIRCVFFDYIDQIAYDCEDKMIRIIFKEGYTLKFSQNDICPINQFQFSTYVNCIPVNYATSTTTNNRYAYGYLLFYNDENNFTVDYPVGSLPSGKEHVDPLLLNETMQHYCDNLTLNLSTLIRCKIDTIESVSLKATTISTKVDVKILHTYGPLLRKIIRCLKPCSDICNVWRASNVSKMLQKYINMLTASFNIIEMSNTNLLTAANSFLKPC